MIYDEQTDPRLPFLIVEDVRTYRIQGGKKRMRLRTAIKDYCESRAWEKDRDRWKEDLCKWSAWIGRKEDRFGRLYHDRILIPRYVSFVTYICRLQEITDAKV